MKLRERITGAVGGVSILYWLLFLKDVDSYYAPYLVVGLAGICLGLRRHILQTGPSLSKKEYLLTDVFAAAMACMVLLANYQYFSPGETRFANLRIVMAALTVMVGGFASFRELLLGIACFGGIEPGTGQKKGKDRLLWAGMWGILAGVNAFVLFMAAYPGILTQDSINQMRQIAEGVYSNAHPYYHTQLIRVCVKIGMWIFHDINAGVALYSCFSIAVMALCFVYVAETIDRVTGNRTLSVILFVWYLIMPYHITYSFTMWKDVFFGAVVTGLVVSVYRYLCKVGNQTVNFIVITVMSFGVCLLRSNGWTAFFLTAAAFAVLYKMKNRKLLITFVLVLVSSFAMKHPVLQALDVSQPDLMEAVGIPVQQIARVVADGHALSEEQSQLLEKVVDIEKIPETYVPYITNDTKDLVREKGNLEYISTHKMAFIKLYVQLGIQHPVSYIKAWIDETRGYWNAGYDRWKWRTEVRENDLGIQRTVHSESVFHKLELYLDLWETNPVLQLFVSIGFCTWIMLLCMYRAIIRRNKTNIFIGIPFLAIIATLLVAAPVYAEFRYVYALFCAAPFVIILTLFNLEQTKDDRPRENSSSHGTNSAVAL